LKISAKELIIKELIPLSREGLKSMNINEADISKYLDIIEERASRHMTGARWQLRSYTKLAKESNNNDEALTILTESMYEQQQKNIPVHEWREPEYKDHKNYKPENQTVAEFMETDLFTAKRSDLAELVAHLMSWKNLGHMAVENKKGNLVGLVSLNKVTEVALKKKRSKKSKDLLVKDVMQADPVTVSPDASIMDALQLMIDKDVTCLPVIVKKELVGIITQKHLLKINKSLMRRLG